MVQRRKRMMRDVARDEKRTLWQELRWACYGLGWECPRGHVEARGGGKGTDVTQEPVSSAILKVPSEYLWR